MEMEQEEGEGRSSRRSDGEIKICCLCGDIGFADALLRCPRCRYRLQHTYCSRLYPDKIDIRNWGCDWCIHHQHHQEEDQEVQRKRPISSGAGGGAHSKAVDRWRRLARAAKMGSGRRYKLLADVLCSS